MIDKKRINEILHRDFNWEYLKRGKGYLKENRVLSLSAEELDDGVVIRSKVRGNYRSSYVQEIFIGRDRIVGECTCPVEFNCKHVAAVILKYLKNLETTEEKEIDKKRRLEYLKKLVFQIRRKTASGSPYFLTYRIRRVNLPFNFFGLTVHKSSFSQCGKEKILRIGKALSIEGLIGNSDRDYIRPEDLGIIKLLENTSVSYFKNSHSLAEIEGEVGTLILERAASTGRLFWEDRTVPIKGEISTLPCRFTWKEEEKGLKLEIEPDMNGLFILPTVPTLIYSHRENSLSKLGEAIDRRFIEELSKLPPLEPSEAAQVYLLLRDLNLDVEKVEGVTTEELFLSPIPVLRLFREKDRYIVDMKFRYGEVEVSPDSPESTLYFSNEKGAFKVKRDSQREKEFLRRINLTNVRKFFMWSEFRGRLEVSSYVKRQFELLKGFFILDVPKLKKEGWEIIVGEGFFNLDQGEVVSSFEEESDGWFSLSFKLKVGNREFSLPPILKQIFELYDPKNLPEVIYVEYEKDRFVPLKREEIKPVINTISQLLDRVSGSKVRVSLYDLHLIEVDVPEKLEEMRKRLKNFRKVKRVKPPEGLRTNLRNYQIDGISWLNFLYEYRLGGILADDMGLGKTVQTIAHLLRLKENGKLEKPALVVVPTTLIANWEREIENFAPNLSYTTVYGKNRKKKLEEAFKGSTDLILTTYNLILKDKELYREKEFSFIILDEAQKVKNYRTKTYGAVVSLKGENRLALSGTPIENNLSELWALFNFLMPGFLGTINEFKKNFQNPIEKGDSKLKKLLGKRVRPFILRRTKKEVLKELPPKVEIVKLAKFSEKEARLYESIRSLMEKEVRKAIEKFGFKRSHIYILEALLKLRQVCCHPSLLKIEEAKKVKESAKLELLRELLEELISEGRKVLIFSQFVSMLKIIEESILKKAGYSYEVLTGSTRDRKRVIERFKEGKDVFLISLKAGGLGLNLTEADTVILYEPWWNPAVESQATDRVYRIGQKNKVFIYKLIVENSVEEKILELQKKKKDLQALYEEGADLGKLSKEELLSLFKK
jgi:SNF2 family DNA or RNA helicase